MGNCLLQPALTKRCRCGRRCSIVDIPSLYTIQSEQNETLFCNSDIIALSSPVIACQSIVEEASHIRKRPQCNNLLRGNRNSSKKPFPKLVWSPLISGNL